MKKIIDISSVWAYTDEIWVIYLSSIIDVSWLGCAVASMLTCHMVVSHLFESPRHFFFYLPGLPGCHSLTWIPGKVPERAIVTTSPIHCRPLCWCANRLASTLSIVLYEMNRSDFILKELCLQRKPEVCSCHSLTHEKWWTGKFHGNRKVGGMSKREDIESRCQTV